MKPIVWMLGLIFIAVGCNALPPVSPTTLPSATPTEEPFYAWDFTLTALTGEAITLSDLRGKWVIVNFWATWCVPCVEEMPIFQDIADHYGDQVMVLGINQREPLELIQTFVSNHDIGFTILINPDDATLMNYQVMGLPQTLVVDPHGELVWRQFGPVERDQFQLQLDALMRQRT